MTIACNRSDGEYDKFITCTCVVYAVQERPILLHDLLLVASYTTLVVAGNAKNMSENYMKPVFSWPSECIFHEYDMK